MSGSLSCPRCRKTLDYSGDRPSFCAYCGHALAETEVAGLTTTGAAEPVPAIIGGYRLLRPLGAGGMGTVHEAEEVATGRRVALKLIAADHADSPDAVERFRREGRLASAISHPRCVFVHAADEENGRPYIVMELMPGPTLQDRLDQDGPLPVDEAVARILDVIEGLQEAHRLGVVHRDVKPSNCFLDREGRAKVGDFGLSKSLTANVRLTGTGAFLGTVLYAAPEQLRGQGADRQSDVYAVAATLYALLTGRAPFEGGDAAATVARIVADNPPSLRDRRPDVPTELDRVVLRGLDRDRTRRFADLEELRLALVPFAPGHELAAPLGMRFVALLVDVFLLFTVEMVIFWVIYSGLLEGLDPGKVTLGAAFVGPLLCLAYYTSCDALGVSLGKRLMRLRVRSLANDRPGLGRALRRVPIFYVLMNLGGIVTLTLLLIFYGPNLPTDPFQMGLDPRLMAIGLVQYIVYPLGWALLLGTMRARNGWRGLHEWASDTRVIALPARPERWRVPGRTLDERCAPAPELPATLGPFTVRGRLCEEALLGEDTALGRPVLLWLPSGGASPVTPARREAARATRPRWLASGDRPRRWEAFAAPAGCPLPEWIATAGRLPWGQARQLLHALTDELVAARKEGTLPATLSLHHIWVDEFRHVQLLDVALSDGPASLSRTERPDDRALELLRQAARLALEGRPADADADAASGTVRAPLPLGARKLLDRLFGGSKPFVDLAAWQAALAAEAVHPPEVTRSRRALQVAAALALHIVGVMVLLAPGAVPLFMALDADSEVDDLNWGQHDFEQAQAIAFVATALGPSPTARLHALAQYQADLQFLPRFEAARERFRQYHDTRQAALGPLSRLVYPPFREQIRAMRQGLPQLRLRGNDFRFTAGFWVGLSPGRDQSFRPRLVILAFWPAIWVVWALVARGSLSFPMAGLALVRSDGRKAARWQGALRTLIVWLPIVGLGAASIGLEALYWRSWEAAAAGNAWWGLAVASWWAMLLLLASYPVLSLVWPVRGPHDRLAGTWVVPR